MSKGESAVGAMHDVRWPVAMLALIGLSVLGVSPALASTPATPLEGIDVSHHNTVADWSQVQAAGVSFVIAKATEGNTFVDPMYATYKQQVEARGMAFTAYHFARPDAAAGDAVAEADAFLAAAQLTGKDLVPVLDLEDSGGLGVKKLTTWAKAWLAEVEAKLGVKATIYTSPAFWKQSLGNSRWFGANGYRLWIAHFTTASAPTVPARNWAGHGWTMWQYDDHGTVAGISGDVDRDRSSGTVLGQLKIKNNR